MDDQAARQPPASPQRRRSRVGAVLVAFVLAALTIVWTQRLWIAERIATMVLAGAGAGPVELTITRLGLYGATFSPLRIGDGVGQRIESLDVTYTPGGLWDGQVDSLALRGARLHAALGPDGVTIPGVPLASETEETPSRTLPFRTAVLEDVKATLDTPQGPVTLTVNGRAGTPDGETLDIEGGVEVSSRFGSATGNVAATALATGESYGRVGLRDGTVAKDAFRLSGLRGDLQFIVLADGEADLDANLAGTEATVAGETLTDLRASIGIRRPDANADILKIDALLKSRRGRAEATGTVGRDESGLVRADTKLAVNIALDRTRTTLQGTLSGEMATDSQISGNLRIAGGDLEHDGIGVNGLTGTAKLVRARDGDLTGEIDLAFRGFKADGLSSKPGTLSARLDNDDIALRTSLAWTDGTFTAAADGPRTGPLSFEMVGNFDSVESLARLVDRIDASGSFAFTAKGTVRDPVQAIESRDFSIPALLERVAAQGRVDSGLATVNVPALLKGGSLSGRLDATLDANGIRLQSKGLRLAADSLSPALVEPIPEPLRKQLSGPIHIEIEPQKGKYATAHLSPTDGGFSATVDASLRASAGDDTVSLRGTFNGNLATDGGVLSFTAPRTRIDVSARNLVESAIATRVTVTSLRADRNRIHAAYNIDGRVSHPGIETLQPVRAKFALSGAIDGALDDFSLTAAPGGRVSVEGPVHTELVRLDEDLTVALTKTLRARIRPASGPGSLTYATTLEVQPTRLAVKSGDGWTDIALAALPVTLSGKDGKHIIIARGETIDVPQHKIRAAGIDLDATLGDRIVANLAIDDIRHMGKPAWFTPLRLTANAKQAGDTLRFDARLFDPPERISVGIKGTQNFATEGGQATISSRELTFLPTVLQPAQLFPGLGDALTEVDGSVETEAKLSWGENGLASSLDLLIEARALKGKEFAAENVATVIHFDSLFPLTTPPDQEVAVGLLDVGVPLTNGRVVFQLNPDERVHAALRELDFFGGRIDTESFTMPKSFDDFSVPLRVNGVSLEQLLALAKSGDLTATGTLNGSIPVVIKDGRVAVRNGVLESEPGGGSIRYTPTGVGPALSEANEGTKLFLDIVKDFQYDSIRVTLDEDETGNVAFQFKVKGRNRLVYDGVPVILNISMDGPLRKILGQGLKTYTLPENLLKRIQQFRKEKQDDVVPDNQGQPAKSDGGEAGNARTR